MRLLNFRRGTCGVTVATIICLTPMGCGPQLGYTKSSQEVIFTMRGDIVTNTSVLVEDVDVEGFQILSHPEYGSDEQHVFFRGEKIWGADPATFSLLEFPFSHDDKHVFNGNVLIVDATPRDFRIVRCSKSALSLTGGRGAEPVFGDLSDRVPPGGVAWVFTTWSLSKEEVFFGPCTVQGGRPDTFRAMSASEGTDDEGAFYYAAYRFESKEAWLQSLKQL